mgnify:CR=1 FL=1
MGDHENKPKTEYKVRGIHTPVVDKLDPSQSFVGQLRKATKMMANDDPQNFKNVADSLIKAKKDKQSTVREAQKQLTI